MEYPLSGAPAFARAPAAHSAHYNRLSALGSAPPAWSQYSGVGAVRLRTRRHGLATHAPQLHHLDGGWAGTLVTHLFGDYQAAESAHCGTHGAVRCAIFRRCCGDSLFAAQPSTSRRERHARFIFKSFSAFGLAPRTLRLAWHAHLSCGVRPLRGAERSDSRWFQRDGDRLFDGA